MIRDLGTVRPGTTLRVPFHTFDSNDPSASVTITGLATTDIEIYKDGGTTQRASDSGYALLDTDGIDFDGTTGIHAIEIDLSDNTTANFYEAGSQYWVVVASITVYAATVNFVLCTFTIGYPDAVLNTTIATLSSQTSFTLEEGPADDDALNGMPCIVHDLASAVQIAKGVISDYTGSTRTVTLDADPGIFTMAAGDHFSVFIGDAMSAAARSNIEDTFDGTGYVDDNAPATQAAVAGISDTSMSLVSTADDDNANGTDPLNSVSFVGAITGTNANLDTADGTYMVLDDTANAFDMVVQHDIPANGVALSVEIEGYLNGSNDAANIQIYDHNATSWVTKATWAGKSGTENDALSIPLGEARWSSSAGAVFVRHVCTGQSNPQLNLDRQVVTYQNQTVGYLDGRVWVDTNNGTAGTTTFVNGTADNPTNTWANAITIATALGISPRFEVVAGSSITLSGDSSNYDIHGAAYTLAFGGQTTTGAYINGATLSGTFAGTTAIIEDCIINAITGPGITMRRCFFNDVTITANAAGDWYLNDCRSRVAGTGSPNFDFGVGVANVNVSLRAYSGGLEVENIGDTGTDNMSMEGDGALTLNANCDGGTIAVRGNIRITDNSGGNVTLSITPDATGYQEGSVWCDETSGTSSGAVVGVDGTFQNQSDDFDNAQDIADAIGTPRIVIAPGTSVTLTDALQGYQIENVQATLTGGSQNIDSTRINGGFLAGTFARAGTGVPTFSNCNLNGVTSDRVACLNNCGILGTFTISEAGVYVFNDAQAAGATSISTLDFGSLAATASFQRWSGTLVVNNLVSGATLNLHCTSGDDITLNGADATVNISGVIGTLTNNLTGSPTVTDNSITLANINAQADTAISDAEPVSANVTQISGSSTAADNLESSTLGIVPTTVNDASASTTSFVTALSEATDDHYNGRIIIFTSGALAGQATDITDYNGTTKAVTVTALTEAPANGVSFVIV